MDIVRILDPKTNKKGEAEDPNKKYAEYVKVAIEQTYFFPCMKTCFTNYTDTLSGPEKICLAKCVDRAHDYMMLERDNLNIYNKNNASAKKK